MFLDKENLKLEFRPGLNVLQFTFEKENIRNQIFISLFLYLIWCVLKTLFEKCEERNVRLTRE